MAVTVRYRRCECTGWITHVAHGNCLEFYGDKVNYCPWCGDHILYEEQPLTSDEIRKLRELI